MSHEHQRADDDQADDDQADDDRADDDRADDDWADDDWAVRDEFALLRWRRHGKDRLYVARSDGTKVGYWDLLTDQGHPERPELAALLAAAVTTSSWPPPDLFTGETDTVEAAVWRP